MKNRNYTSFGIKKQSINSEIERLKKTFDGAVSLEQLLKRNEMSYEKLPQARHDLPAMVRQQVEIIVKYSGYIDRQEDEVARFRQMEDKQIPDWLEYENISGLRNESRQKLADHRPATLGQASHFWDFALGC